MQNEFFAADHHGMAGIRAALIARHDIGLFTEQINDFAFAFIAPLRANNNLNGHDGLIKRLKARGFAGWPGLKAPEFDLNDTTNPPRKLFPD